MSPMAIMCLLIESSLLCTHISHLHAKRTSNGSCCCWKFLCQLVQMHTDTSSFSVHGTSLQSHTELFEERWLDAPERGSYPQTLQANRQKLEHLFLQPLQLCSPPIYKQKCFVLPCSKLLWLSLSFK